MTDVYHEVMRAIWDHNLQAGARRHYDALVAAHGEKARQYLDQILSPLAIQPSLGCLPAVARV